MTRPLRMPLVLVTAIVALLLYPLPAHASAGDLDPTFSGDGIQVTGFPGTGTYFGVAIHGNAPTGCGSRKPDAIVGSYRHGGALNPAFSGDGKARIDFLGGYDSLIACRYLSDGRLVAVGTAPTIAGRNRLVVVMFTANGHLDRHFSGDGWNAIAFPNWPDVYGYDVAALPGGKILAVGETYDSSSAPAHGNFAVARFTPGGALDRTFSGDGRVTVSLGPGDDGVSKVVVSRGGAIVLAGWSLDPSGQSDTGVAILKANGVPDRTFGGDGRRVYDLAPAGRDSALGLAVRSDGRIVLGVDLGGTPNDSAVVQLKPGSAMDPSFGGGDGIVQGLTPDFRLQDLLLDGGKIVVGGDRWADDTPVIARLRPGGSLDGSFGTGGVGIYTALTGTGFIYDLAVGANGRIVAAGEFAGQAIVLRVLS
jgi:uncharacterized delta-60 repeat protein